MNICKVEKRCNSPKGSKNHRAKLTEKDVLEIRYLHEKERFSPKQLAGIYEVQTTNIYKIINYQSWKHLDGGVSEEWVKALKG